MPGSLSEAGGMFANLGLSLRLFREMRGLSQDELARRAGISKSRLSKYENGRRLPKLDSLERLLLALDYRQDALFSTVTLLDQLPLALGREPGTPLTLLSILPQTGSVPSLDQAFEASMRSLLALQRAVLEALLAGAAGLATPPLRRQPPRKVAGGPP